MQVSRILSDGDSQQLQESVFGELPEVAQDQRIVGYQGRDRKTGHDAYIDEDGCVRKIPHQLDD